MFTGKVLFVGFGSIGQAVAPALLSHLKLSPSRVRAIAADADGAAVAAALGIEHRVEPIYPDNLEQVLGGQLGPGDLLLNVSVHVSSKALIQWCQANDVLYLDTCVEPWEGGYHFDDASSKAAATNYVMREDVLKLRGEGRPTAVIAHGANPGIISHLVKAGLMEMARVRGVYLDVLGGERTWGNLAKALGVRVIQIAERDTQRAAAPVPDTFVNTWSAEGLLAEAWQCAELGWGTHEQSLPADGVQHSAGSRAGIFLDAHSVDVRVQSWVPSAGAQDAFLITHHEAISLADYLTVPGEGGAAAYRPTVYYAYAPCPATQQCLADWARGGHVDPAKKLVLRDELESGFDQLGVLFVYEGGAFWFGSTVELEYARRLTPYNNATSLQVVAGILGALSWMLANPDEGLVEAEDLPHDEVLKVAMPYLGRVHGNWTDWQPQRSAAAQAAPQQPLQFSDFRL
ncbi:Homospermidine synthase [compost metagenome]